MKAVFPVEINKMDENNSPRTFGPKMKIPEGRNFIELVQLAMASGEKNAAYAAAYIGVSRDSYQLARKLLMIQQRQVLMEDDERTLNMALYCLEKKRFKDAVQISKDILALHWNEKKHNGKDDNPKSQKRFENTLFAIREACSNNEEMEIPISITRDERAEAIEVLIESMDSLWKLFTKIRGENKNE